MDTSRRPVPTVNWANGFTMLRVALVPVFAWLLLFRDPPVPVVAALVFAAAAATDGLDGWVARRLDLVTGFGQFLDPLADKLLVGTALVALALDGRIPWWAVAVILGREVAISVLRVWLARTGRSLPASSLAKAKTASQIAAVVVVTALSPRHPVAAAVLWLAIALTLVSGWQYVAGVRSGRSAVPWT